MSPTVPCGSNSSGHKRVPSRLQSMDRGGEAFRNTPPFFDVWDIPPQEPLSIAVNIAAIHAVVAPNQLRPLQPGTASLGPPL